MVADLAVFLPLAIRSDQKSRKPVSSRATPMKMVLPYSPSTLLLMGRMTNSGRVAMMIIRIIRPSGGRRFISLRFWAEKTHWMRWTSSFSRPRMSFR